MAANSETIDIQTAGYLNVTVFLFGDRSMYGEFFIDEVLPMLEFGNRIYWVKSF